MRRVTNGCVYRYLVDPEEIGIQRDSEFLDGTTPRF